MFNHVDIYFQVLICGEMCSLHFLSACHSQLSGDTFKSFSGYRWWEVVWEAETCHVAPLLARSHTHVNCEGHTQGLWGSHTGPVMITEGLWGSHMGSVRLTHRVCEVCTYHPWGSHIGSAGVSHRVFEGITLLWQSQKLWEGYIQGLAVSHMGSVRVTHWSMMVILRVCEGPAHGFWDSHNWMVTAVPTNCIPPPAFVTSLWENVAL